MWKGYRPGCAWCLRGPASAWISPFWPGPAPGAQRYQAGHVLTVAVAMLLAILTERSDLCIAGVFGAGKTRSLAVLLIALSCELDDFSPVVYTKENVAAKASLIRSATSLRRWGASRK